MPGGRLSSLPGRVRLGRWRKSATLVAVRPLSSRVLLNSAHVPCQGKKRQKIPESQLPLRCVFDIVGYRTIVLKKSAMKPWIHSHRSVLIKVDATSSP